MGDGDGITPSIAAGTSFGSVYGPTPVDPALPAVLNFTVVPSGHNRTPQLAAYEEGRRRLLTMSARELEHALWDVIDRTLTPLGGDFEARRDVSAIMLNPFRNVAIANSDSASFAYTHSAIDEGYRAVQDLPG
jgi:spermidine dehydrogenase